MDETEGMLELNDAEIEVVRRAALARKLEFDSNRRTYSSEELAKFGVIREAYNRDEIKKKDLWSHGVVTSFDAIAQRAKSELLVDTPFASGVAKWQLPIELSGTRIMLTSFAPNTVVRPHAHPIWDEQNPGGGFRMVIRGSITYQGRKFGPGDWFYIPNGIEYSFVTDPTAETEEAYSYTYIPHPENPNPKPPPRPGSPKPKALPPTSSFSSNRFSHPIAARGDANKE